MNLNTKQIMRIFQKVICDLCLFILIHFNPKILKLPLESDVSVRQLSSGHLNLKLFVF